MQSCSYFEYLCNVSSHIVVIDFRDNSHEKSCNWERNIGNRLIFLRVQMCPSTRFAQFINRDGRRWLEAIGNSEDDLHRFREENNNNVIIVDSCMDWNETKKHII